MKVSEFDYELPKELIANRPIEPRDHSRLMVVNREKRTIEHRHFFDLPEYVNDHDVLVFNDTKVFPARLAGTKETGGKVEILITKVDGKSGVVECIGKNIGRAKKLNFGDQLVAKVTAPGKVDFEISFEELMEKLKKVGQTPLPPYIKPPVELDEAKLRELYQTVYAVHAGSAAAPTAGFHFTPALLAKLKDQGVSMEKITLHVGLGTFAPLKSERVEDNKLHSEWFEIPEDIQTRISGYRGSGKRIIGVGTTSVRALESEWDKQQTDIFIYPGFEFRIVDGMITNFHLPKSSLLMLVCAFGGRELIMKAYEEAVRERYRFFSFGDAMLIV